MAEKTVYNQKQEYISRKELFKFLDTLAAKLKEQEDYQSQIGALIVYSVKEQLRKYPFLVLSFEKGET